MFGNKSLSQNLHIYWSIQLFRLFLRIGSLKASVFDNRQTWLIYINRHSKNIKTVSWKFQIRKNGAQRGMVRCFRGINMLLESDRDSIDNSIACAIKELKRLAYQGDKIRTLTYFCCSYNRFFDFHSCLLLILKNHLELKNKFQMLLVKVCLKDFLNATSHIYLLNMLPISFISSTELFKVVFHCWIFR